MSLRSKPRLLCIGGDDHQLRIPFLLGLRDAGFDAVAAGSGDPAPFADVGIPYHRYDFRRSLSPRHDVRAIGALIRIIRDVRPDLVQTFDTKPNLLVALAKRRAGGFRLVRTINGMGWIFSANSLSAWMLRPVYRSLQRIADPQTDLTVFQNSEDQEYFVQHRMARREAARIICGSGVDVVRFDAARRQAESPEAIRAALGLRAARVVITVTRMTRLKGIATLLAAADLVHKVREDVHFLLVGPLEEAGRFAIPAEEIAGHADYVTWLGPRDDIPALLGAADLFVLPTEFREGLPRVLLEASLAGLPIITTNMPGCMAVVRSHFNGLLIPPRDPGFLAAQILTLLDDPELARTMGRQGAEMVRREFDLAGTTEAYIRLYRDVIQDAPVTEHAAALADAGPDSAVSRRDWTGGSPAPWFSADQTPASPRPRSPSAEDEAPIRPALSEADRVGRGVVQEP
ncbi:glycosyltransferase family 4 protein [Methylobacterium durans]|uniref:glycosyltransferase family 4 protein n=1 Tax=Methylobacterium durans TaxID=2202825 RepID=UPI002AFE49BD|nr:glycosyltransferase family 4 protein [Methylobacterium durans]MEA1834420.1 glycosyltransferase family 4 protein [Methylobacterium durans]